MPRPNDTLITDTLITGRRYRVVFEGWGEGNDTLFELVGLYWRATDEGLTFVTRNSQKSTVRKHKVHELWTSERPLQNSRPYTDEIRLY